MKRIYVFLTMLCSLFMAASCILDKNSEDKEYEMEVGQTIPDFTVTMNDGTVVTGADLRKGNALIMFFHTDCPDCQGTLPSVQKII